jgi:hypothetical protein
MTRMKADYSPSLSPDGFSRSRPFVLLVSAGQQRFRLSLTEFRELQEEMRRAINEYHLANNEEWRE